MPIKEHCQILISAPSEAEAKLISGNLLEKKLIAGSLISSGLSSYWWQGKQTEKTYWNISAFSMFKNKQKIIAETKKLHTDKCPIIAFTAIDGNKEFLQWITKSTHAK